ncbi:hypothetical protein DFH28DRAFT_1181670 [Melampsora americana]|nr:hypothetical protein DFH28DRAFT_1181670 [Melampsora americana]
MNSPHQRFPQQPFQPMHNDPIDPARHPFRPINRAHQDFDHQRLQSMHQTYQAHRHQAHEGYQAQPQAHQPHQAGYQAQPQAHQPHQAQFHQGLQPLDPMFQDPSSQRFEHDYGGFSQPNNHQAIPQDQSNPNQLHQAFNLNQIEPRSQQLSHLSHSPQIVHNLNSSNQTLSQPKPSQSVPAVSESQHTKSKTKKKSDAAAKDSTDSTRNVLNGFLPKTLYNDVLDLDVEGLTAEELMDRKSLDQLRISAEQVGKRILSEDDEIHFRNLQNQMTKVLAINCLGRGVRLSAVKANLGRKQPFRELTRWHAFTQAPENRAIYREHGGVKSGVAAKILKSEYDRLTEEEKNEYKPKTKLEIIIDQGEEDEPIDNNAGVPSQSGNGADQGIDSAIPMRKKSRSFVEDQGVVINWLKNVNSTMHRLAVTYHLEGFVVLVSTHVAHGSLQLIRATPGALRWHDAAKRVNPQDNCVTNLQSFILGQKVGLVSQDSSEKDQSEKSQARHLLADRLAEISNERYKKWPWRNCVGTLKSWGYEVSLLPNACSRIEWITCQKGSNALTNSQARLILKDLHMDLIQLSKLTNPSESTDSAPLKKRVRLSSDVEEEEEE